MIIKLTKEQKPFDKEILELLKLNQGYKYKKLGSSPQAKKVRVRLRELGVHVSGFDIREGKPRRRMVKRPTKPKQ